jgi:phosphoribosylanthranilate isomerase
MMAKVCGITGSGDLAGALAAGADLVGFLRHLPSPRHCADPSLARGAGDRGVLVVVAATLEALREEADHCPASWVQPYLPAELREPALALLRSGGRRVLLPWPDEAGQPPLRPDLFLWESSPRATGLLGGSGQGHAMAFPPPGPFLLAGGLQEGLLRARLEAMPAAIRSRCRGFDAASRLEAHPGRKDPARVSAFVLEAHALKGDSL